MGALRAAVLGLLCASLLACGFQLRSYDFGGSIESYSLTGKTDLDVTQPLRRGLNQAGLEAVAEDANLVLELLQQRRDRRTLSTTNQARAAEFESSYGVQYRLLDAQGVELLPSNWVERSRIYRINRDNIVGSNQEQALLERELMQDVVAQIIRSISIVSRAKARAAKATADGA